MTTKKGFSEGWATKRADGTPHYFRRDGLGLARSICGAQDAPAGWLSMTINSRCCERCARLRDKERVTIAGASDALEEVVNAEKPKNKELIDKPA